MGASLDANFDPRAFLWEKGVMTDLNTLIAGDSPLYLSLIHILGYGSALREVACCVLVFALIASEDSRGRFYSGTLQKTSCLLL